MSLRAFGFPTLVLATGMVGLFSLDPTDVLRAAPATAKPESLGPSSLPTYEVEWVYQVRWGHDDEFWRLFQKTQIPVLDKQKELGYIVSYQVYRPGLHTSEDSRWTYRIVIKYKDILSSTKESVVTNQLFPDRAAYRKDENSRWELVEAHYDLPIREIDPHATE